MDAKQFFEEVAKMRRYQKEYFKYKTSVALNLSKSQEKLIDKEIERVNSVVNNKQMDLGL